MPVAVGTRWPPKHCTICRQTVSATVQARNEQARNVYEAWRFYKSHLQQSHPQYASWNRRTSMIYLIPIALIILPAVIGIGQFVSANDTLLVFEVSWALMLVTLVSVFVLKSVGRRRFRKLWNEQHNAPVGLL